MKAKKKPTRCKNQVVDTNFDFPCEIMDEFKEPETWTIITALDRILEKAEDSHLSDEFWASVKNPLAFLRQELGLTDMQIVTLALMVETGEAVTWKRMGRFLGCSRLSIMVYSEEIEELVTKRWAYRRNLFEFGSSAEGFKLVRGVLTALRHNKAFVPEKIDGLNEQQFVDKLSSRISKTINNRDVDFKDEEEWMFQLVKANPQLPLCHELLKFDDIHVVSLMLLTVADYAEWAGSESEGLNFETIDNVYPDDYECDGIRYELRTGTHLLIEGGYIEHKCVDGQVNVEAYMLTRKTKNELLSAYKPNCCKCVMKSDGSRFLKSHTTIKEKPLFFNSSEQAQVEWLTGLLSQENLPSIQQRLEESGMRRGFACMFYGAPGTGKTETVLQIARQTGRDIMQVDIAGMRDKFVGESEKNIKDVFSTYRKLCQNSEVMPILFFNEADGIFGKRTTFKGNSPSVEKMDNAMQNIILQEMEDLDGILIATTNLTCNFDSAFERRFFCKIEFHKPNVEVKAKIWRAMLKDISADEALQLAAHFDFSGGQIENIARKRTVDYILSGKHASLEDIENYCRAEVIDTKTTRHHIAGFSA